MITQKSLPSVGIIGYGNMGSAVARTISRSRILGTQSALYIYAKGRQPAESGLKGVFFTNTLEELVTKSGIIIIAVRPEQVEGVILDMRGCITDEDRSASRLLVSLAAGVPLASLRAVAGAHFVAIRVMPNTLVEVGKGLFGLCAGPDVSPDEKDLVHSLFAGVGSVLDIDESQMNSFTALAGCGPGFLFHIMDAFCEAGVSVGLTREASRAITVSLMGGCGLLAETTGRHPVLLRERGTSPAGMTIAGLNYLDIAGVRGHLIEAVKTARRQGEAMAQVIKD